MKEYKEEKVMRAERKLVALTCDLCGVAAKHPSNGWETGHYETNEVIVAIRHREGESYPEGSYGTDYGVDMCPKCFQERLIPWLKSQGAKVQETEYDF